MIGRQIAQEDCLASGSCSLGHMLSLYYTRPCPCYRCISIALIPNFVLKANSEASTRFPFLRHPCNTMYCLRVVRDSSRKTLRLEISRIGYGKRVQGSKSSTKCPWAQDRFLSFQNSSWCLPANGLLTYTSDPVLTFSYP